MDPLPPPLAPPTIPGVDPAGVVAVDRTCRQCGYNIRGLHIAGRCPECGTPVELSARGDYLEFSAPAWVRKLVGGSRLIYRGVMLALLTFVLLAAGIVAIIALLDRPGMAAASTGMIVLVFGLMFSGAALLTATIMAAIGLWKLTAAEPGADESSVQSRARVVVRVGLVVTFFAPYVPILVQGLNLPAEVLVGVVAVFAPLQLASLYAVNRYYRWIGDLARRVPDDKMRQRCGMFSKSAPTVLFFPVLAMALAFFTPVFAAAGPATTSGPTSGASITGLANGVTGITSCGCCVATPLLLIQGLLAMRLQRHLTNALDVSAKRAEYHWFTAAAAAREPGNKGTAEQG